MSEFLRVLRVRSAHLAFAPFCWPLETIYLIFGVEALTAYSRDVVEPVFRFLYGDSLTRNLREPPAGCRGGTP